MQVDGTTYGIIPDTFDTILNNYLNPLLNTFPNATSINSPIYALAYVTTTQDQLLQAALTSLWNAINANTAQGTGLDILSNTVLNLIRPGLVPSSCQVQVTIGPIYSACQVQMTVTGIDASPPYTIPIGWQASGGVTTTAPYLAQAEQIINGTGVYYFNVYSLDTSTPVPASNFTSGSSVSGVTYSLTNPASAVLGNLTIPTTWYVSANLPNNVVVAYSPNATQTYTTAGTYTFLVYSQNITTPISAQQLVTPSSTFNGLLLSVTNLYPAILGIPALDDAAFSALRRNYLNVTGQTYYGLEKAIVDLNIPALTSVFIAETISETTNYSVLIIQTSITVASGGSSSVTLPNNWTVLGSASPDPNYHTLEEYSFTSSGTYYLPTYSTDTTTQVAISSINSASPTVSGVNTVTNLVPAIQGSTLVPNGLGQRGYTVYLQYPTINPQSYCVVNVNVSMVGMSPPYTIPIGWTATGFSTVSPYITRTAVTVSSTGTYALTCYSNDLTTSVPAYSFTSGSSVSGLTFSAYNPNPAVLGGGFDTNDPYLQQIAFTCYSYHPLGTQFYPAPLGATVFTVNTPYSGYTSPVTLNPFQTTEVSCNLQILYNSNPLYAGYNTGLFDTSLLPTLQTTILGIINNYFLSKTLPTDLIYSINELSEILQQSFTGIVALVGNAGAQFSFGIVSVPSTGLLFLTRSIGYNFNLLNTNFTFSAVAI